MMISCPSRSVAIAVGFLSALGGVSGIGHKLGEHLALLQLSVKLDCIGNDAPGCPAGECCEGLVCSGGGLCIVDNDFAKEKVVMERAAERNASGKLGCIGNYAPGCPAADCCEGLVCSGGGLCIVDNDFAKEKVAMERAAQRTASGKLGCIGNYAPGCPAGDCCEGLVCSGGGLCIVDNDFAKEKVAMENAAQRTASGKLGCIGNYAPGCPAADCCEGLVCSGGGLCIVDNDFAKEKVAMEKTAQRNASGKLGCIGNYAPGCPAGDCCEGLVCSGGGLCIVDNDFAKEQVAMEKAAQRTASDKLGCIGNYAPGCPAADCCEGLVCSGGGLCIVDNDFAKKKVAMEKAAQRNASGCIGNYAPGCPAGDCCEGLVCSGGGLCIVDNDFAKEKLAMEKAAQRNASGKLGCIGNYAPGCPAGDCCEGLVCSGGGLCIVDNDFAKEKVAM